MAKNCFVLLAMTVAFIPGVEGATNSVPSFVVQVELSKPALEKLRRSGESVVVAAEFADEIGPGGNYYGEMRYEVFKPSLVTIGEISIPTTIDEGVKPVDFEVNVNVFSGRRSSKINILRCDFVQGMLSELRGRENVVRCDIGK